MLRIILFIAIVLFNVASFAKGNNVIIVVSEVKGNAFYSLGGSTYGLQTGMHLPAKAEIFTEVGSQITFNDYYDHIFYLSGGAHLIVHPNLVELKEGYLWIKALSYDGLRGPLKVTTANALIEHRVGEGILSFDNFSGKTQVLSIKGDFDLKNIRQEFQWTQVTEGQFSFIQDEYNNGAPRRSTPIGYASYKKVTSLFNGVEAFEKEKVERSQKVYPASETVPHNTLGSTQRKRGIASVQPVDSFEQALNSQHSQLNNQEVNSGTITVIKLRDPKKEKEHENELLKFYQNKVTELGKPKPAKKWTPSYKEKSGVPVTIFGHGMKHKPSTRMPASIKPAQTNRVEKKDKPSYRTPASVGGMVPTVNSRKFESELVNQYKNQMRHEQEVNELIDQLKSIDMDYKKEY
jgi:hypothetical protein